ncbi:OX-2 membrane glycoprotein-like [Amphiprion ocellaris]|uniref:Ig-like domain-containing protein n=1 Tax=Amphiprion ocellaris TaxID=80972 RepID=A0A3Q1CGH2_AMPOC|nr:OX-2 membrane glycoprotein-like [Amphiprion ocellaris]
MFWVLMLVCLLHGASATQIRGFGNSTALYGDDAHYWCAVDNPTGVLQVTWQRLYLDESIENLATYSKRFGEQVNQPYKRKVIFTKASLSSTSITLKNATWEDESCYICSFNVYPDGSKRRQTCLKVLGISAVNTSHTVSREQQEDGRTVVFSCSATGKPAPTIRWDYSSGASSIHQPQTDVVTNSDQTFTSSSSVTLKFRPDWRGHVDCVLNAGMDSQRQERINFTLSDEEKKPDKGSPPSAVALVITAVIFISCITVTAVMLRKRLKDKHKGEITEQQVLDHLAVI